jgi:hypothetical protein
VKEVALAYFEVLLRHFSEGTVENHKNDVHIAGVPAKI